jgi:uncharacterized protein (TIGR02284 family)
MTSKLPDHDDETDDVIDELNELVQLGYDTIAVYETALDKVRDTLAKGDLIRFKVEHEGHLEDLARLVLSLGGLPKDGRSLRGVLVDGLTAVRAATGDIGALRAMRMNERIINRTYRRVLAAPLSDDIREVVLSHREDERRHLLAVKAHLARIDEDFQEEVDDEQELLEEDSELAFEEAPLSGL